MATPSLEELMKNGTVLKPVATKPSKSAKERGWGERFVDSLKDATQYGFPGWAARKINDFRDAGKAELKKKYPKWNDEQLENASDQLIADTQRRLRAEAQKKQEADPNWRPDESFVDAALGGRWAPWLAGQVLGSAGPEMLIGGGAAPAARVMIQGAAGAGTDLAYQGLDKYDTVRDDINLAETAISALGNAGMAAGLEGLGRLAGKVWPKAEPVSIEDQASRALGDARFTPKALPPKSGAPTSPKTKAASSEASPIAADLDTRLVEAWRQLAEEGDTGPNSKALWAEIQDLEKRGAMLPGQRPPAGAEPVPPASSAPSVPKTPEEQAQALLGDASFEAKPIFTPQDPALDTRLIEAERRLAEVGDTHPEAGALWQEIQALREAGAAHPADNAPFDWPSTEPDGPTLSWHQTGDDVVSRLTTALKSAGKASKEQMKALSERRKADAARLANLQKSTSGEAGLKAELAALRGQTPKAAFEEIKDQFSQQDVTNLFNMVKATKALSPYDSLNARTALWNLLEGKVPTPSQLALLQKTFPPDFIKEVMKKRARGEKIADFIGNAVNLPRSLMSSFDLSAPFRQGLFLIGRKEFWKSFPEMFNQFAKGMKDDVAFDEFMAEIKNRPTAELMDEAGLSFGDVGTALLDREEAFMSRWAERIPGIGRVVRGSERGYTAFLNKLRADTFDDMVRLHQNAGIDLAEDPKALADMAKFINAATGRGDLGKLAQAGPLLNGLFFSPRLIASRVQLLRPSQYAALSPIVRKEALKSLVSLGAIATTVGGLAAMAGLPVETDPRSTDFMKIRVGNTRYDILGGFGQYITLGARLAMNEEKTAKGDIKSPADGPFVSNRLERVGKFARNKLSPVAAFAADALAGENAIGEEFSVTEKDPFKNAVTQRFIPLILQDLEALYKENGEELLPTVAMGVPTFFGIGAQTYDENAPRTPGQLLKDGEVLEEGTPVKSTEPSLEDLLANGTILEE